MHSHTLIFKYFFASLAALTVGLGCTGCSTLMGENFGTSDQGRILISADAEGMQAFSDLVQGSITNGKQSPDTESAYYGVRREQVRVRALKSYSSFSTQPKATLAHTGGVK